MSLFDTLSSINYDRGLKGLIVPVEELTLHYDGPLIEGHHFQNGRLVTGADAFTVLLLLQDAYLEGDLDDDEGEDDSWY